MKKKDLARQLNELAEGIYENLNEMDHLLREEAPNATYQRAKYYWLAHIDGALFNEGGFLGGSFTSLEDTMKELMDEVCPNCGSENFKESSLGLEDETVCLDCDATWQQA